MSNSSTAQSIIRTPDQRLRVFISSSLQELSQERQAAREAIEHMHLVPVMFDLGARSHPPRKLYRAYLCQSHIFIGIYCQNYGWIAPGETISGLEDEYRLSGNRPKLIYVKSSSHDIDPRLNELLERIRIDDCISYKLFSTVTELHDLILNDLAMLLTEHFEVSRKVKDEVTVPKHNLPTPPTTLIDRERQIACSIGSLILDKTRLLTMVGTGGTGKTRLALEVAFKLVDRFQDGVFFINLSSCNDPELITSMIASSLEIRETIGNRSVIEALKDYLQNRHILLVLDNFEQITSAAQLLTKLLESCPKLQVIVTSRVSLHVRGEREQLVPPLDFPDNLSVSDVECLRKYASVELFIQRALDVKSDFEVTESNICDIAEICCRLDGLPLAIELAAARIKMLPPKLMLARLERRLPLLTEGKWDLPVRQRTLRNTIEWSYNLLDEATKLLFRRLSVFVGGWKLDAAEAICQLGNEPSIDILKELETLLNSNLLICREGPDGEPRLRMLETIREYAQELLAALPNEEEEVRQRHALFYTTLAERADIGLRSADRILWTFRLEAEHDNLRSLLDWCTTPSGNIEMGLICTGALCWFWHARGYTSEGRDWVNKLLASDRANAYMNARAKALWSAGGMAWTQGDYTSARPLIEESVAICRTTRDIRTMIYALTILGMVVISEGEVVKAQSYFEESKTLANQVGDKWCEAFATFWLGNALLASRNLTSARLNFEQSLALFRETGDPWGSYFLRLALGGIALYLDDRIVARDLFEESAALCRNLGDHWGLSWVVGAIGSLELRLGNLREAKVAFEESIKLAREAENPFSLCFGFAGFARLALAQGDRTRAIRLMGAAEALYESLKSPVWPSSRLVYDQNIAEVRAEINLKTFVTDYKNGRLMSLDQAIVYALDQRKELN